MPPERRAKLARGPTLKKVDLNVDIGEGFAYDEALLEFATSANVCCGAHAGSRELTRATIELCRERGVRVGIHPGYPDRASMGREPTSLSEALASLETQLGGFAEGEAAYVKPHGALYNLSAYARERPERVSKGSSYRPKIEPEAARIVEAIFEHATPRVLMGLPETGHELLARRAGAAFIREGFADRRYLPSGRLVPRSDEFALLNDRGEIADQVLRLAPEIDSICLHGDTPDCVEFAEFVVRTLTDAGYEVGH